MIDWQRVDVLQSEVGEDGFIEVVELFLEETDEVIDRFLQTPYTGRLGADLHFLKGSALNLGFFVLAECCVEYEQLLSQGAVDQIILSKLGKIYSDSKAAFQLRLAQMSAA